MACSEDLAAVVTRKGAALKWYKVEERAAKALTVLSDALSEV